MPGSLQSQLGFHRTPGEWASTLSFFLPGSGSQWLRQVKQCGHAATWYVPTLTWPNSMKSCRSAVPKKFSSIVAWFYVFKNQKPSFLYPFPTLSYTHCLTQYLFKAILWSWWYLSKAHIGLVLLAYCMLIVIIWGNRLVLSKSFCCPGTFGSIFAEAYLPRLLFFCLVILKTLSIFW